VSAPEFDPASVYPEIPRARAALAARDWPSFLSSYDGLDWAGRATVVHHLDADQDIERFLAGMVERDPEDVVAASTYATVLVQHGQRLRGAEPAASIGDDQRNGFQAYLRQAEQLLIDTTARDPGAVLAWTERLNTARELGLGLNEARRRYDRVARVDPHNVDAQRRMLRQLCPKWSGRTSEAAQTFAAQCRNEAPAGAHNGVLIADVHIESWLDLDGPGRRAYGRDGAVLAGLQAAAEGSVFHPDFPSTPGWVAVVTAFAFAFGLVEHGPSARRCFEVLGPYASRWPWDQLAGGADTALRRHRERAFAQAGTRRSTT
jgi:hypothetical protein